MTIHLVTFSDGSTMYVEPLNPPEKSPVLFHYNDRTGKRTAPNPNLAGTVAEVHNPTSAAQPTQKSLAW